MAKDNPIKHVVVLMLENNSFDRILGSLSQVKPVDGISPNSPFTNNYSGHSYAQAPDDTRTVSPDPKHDLKDVLIQCSKDNDGNEMSGFVRNFAESYPQLSGDKLGQVMSYYPLNSLPALHQLASEFAVCDRWFSSIPGPTWPNRLFAMTGTSQGRVTMPEGIMDLNLHWYDQPTVFDRLNEKGISWKVYFGDIPVSEILVHQWEPENSARHRPMVEFPLHASAENLDDFPSFAWIEPSYLPPSANDYHPPHDMFDGEELVRSVYNALRSNSRLWNSTLFVLLFDEHGGFFDHVVPPAAISPDHHNEEWTFDRLGVRVPAILISPWVQNTVISKTFDHTSLLKYLTELWGLGPLGSRTANANSIGEAISTESRTDTPASLPSSPPRPIQAIPLQRLSEHQMSLISLSHALESMAEEDAAIVAARSSQVLSGPASQIDAAFDRFAAFLRHRTGLLPDTKLQSSNH
ncbi:MAG: alkaline phosphatase family protein [Nitrososphaera sp.]|jgi:phospholipase C